MMQIAVLLAVVLSSSCGDPTQYPCAVNQTVGVGSTLAYSSTGRYATDAGSAVYVYEKDGSSVANILVTSDVQALAFNPLSAALAVCTAQPDVTLFSLSEPILPLQTDVIQTNEGCQYIAMSHELLAWSSATSLLVLDLTHNGSVVKEYTRSVGGGPVAYSKDGTLFAYADGSKVVITGADSASTVQHNSVVRGIDFTQDNRHLVSVSDDETVVASVVDGEQQSIPSGGSCVAFSPASIVAVGGPTGAVLWDWEAQKNETTSVVEGDVKAVAFTPEGSLGVRVGDRYVSVTMVSQTSAPPEIDEGSSLSVLYIIGAFAGLLLFMWLVFKCLTTPDAGKMFTRQSEMKDVLMNEDIATAE